jgi:glutamine amidotransferase-like uncharacterized protein
MINIPKVLLGFHKEFNATLIEAKERKKQAERELDIQRRKQTEIELQKLKEKEKTITDY